MAAVSAGRIESSTLGKFLIAGGISYLVNQIVLVIFYEGLYRNHTMASTPLGHVDTALLVSSLVALEASILVRFQINDFWTFRGRGSKPYGRRFLESNVSSFGGPIISLVALNLLTPWLGISYLVANSIGILLGPAWNWTWSNRVIWGEHDA